MGLILSSLDKTNEKDTVGSATAQVAFVAEKEGLARLFDAYIAGVIWRRYMQEGMQSWLDALPVDQSPISRIILPVSKVQSAVIELMNISDMPDSPERQVLAAKHLTKADVSSLASLRACGASLRFKPIQ